MIYHERPVPEYFDDDAAARWRRNERTLRRLSIAMAILVPLAIVSALVAIVADIIAIILR